MNILPFEKKIDLDYRPIMTIGMFDGVHIGHQRLVSILIDRARELNTKPIIISFDNHPQLVLKPQLLDKIQLLQTNEERFQKLSSLGIDNILLIHFTKKFASLSSQTFIDLLIQKYNPIQLILGYDNHFGKKTEEEFENLISHAKYKGLDIERINDCIYYNDIEVSSTQIRKALLGGNLTLVKAMLKEDYALTGTIIHGNKIGRTLGFPTANIEIYKHKHKLIPMYGVYIAKASVEGQIYNALVNIGMRPTLQNSSLSIEAHILDFTQSIYDKEITIYLKEFLRPEKRFSSMEELKKEMELDLTKAKEYFIKNE